MPDNLFDIAEKKHVQGEPRRDPDKRPEIPEGVYKMYVHTHETRIMHGTTPKLTLTLEVVEGEHSGTILYRNYNVKSINKEGRVRVTDDQDITNEYHFVVGGDMHNSQFPVSAFDGLTVFAQVEMVKSRWSKKRRHEKTFYSKVAELLRRA